MADKTFIVTHPKARSPLTITGKTLAEALEKEGLNPAIWKEQGAVPESEVEPSGDNQGDGGEEGN